MAIFLSYVKLLKGEIPIPKVTRIHWSSLCPVPPSPRSFAPKPTRSRAMHP